MDAHYRARLLQHLADLSKSPSEAGTSDHDRAILTGLRRTIDQLLELSPPCSPTPAVVLPIRGSMEESEDVGVKVVDLTGPCGVGMLGMERIEEEDEDEAMEDGREVDRGEEKDEDEEEEEEVEEERDELVDSERRFQRLSKILANLQAQAERAVYGPDETEEEDMEGEDLDADDISEEYFDDDGYSEDDERDDSRAWDSSSIHTANSDRGPSYWKDAPRPETRCEMRPADPDIESDLDTPEPETIPDEDNAISRPTTSHSDTQNSNQLDCMRLLTPPPSHGIRRRRRTPRRKTLEPSPVIHVDGAREGASAGPEVIVSEESKDLMVEVAGGADEVERLLVELLQTRETEVEMFRLVWMWMGSLGIVWTLVGWVLGWGCQKQCSV